MFACFANLRASLRPPNLNCSATLYAWGTCVGNGVSCLLLCTCLLHAHSTRASAWPSVRFRWLTVTPSISGHAIRRKSVLSELLCRIVDSRCCVFIFGRFHDLLSSATQRLRRNGFSSFTFFGFFRVLSTFCDPRAQIVTLIVHYFLSLDN